MPTDPVWLTIRDDLRASLQDMSKANGYHLDYAPVQIGVEPAWESEPDFTEPIPFLAWAGGVPPEGDAGDETATNRFRRWERWIVGIAIKDEDPEQTAARVRMDVHTALMKPGQDQATNPKTRYRNTSRGDTYDHGVQLWEPMFDADQVLVGGLLLLEYRTVWDHLSNDMSSEG